MPSSEGSSSVFCDVVMIALVLVMSSPVWAAPAGMEQILAQAKKEGEVIYFTGSNKYPGGDGVAEKAFEHWAGFLIKVRYAALGVHPPVVQKIIQEAKVGISSGVDVFPSRDTMLLKLNKAELLEPVPWNKMGVSDEAIEPKIHGVKIADSFRHVIYNTRMVSANEAPRKFLDLLNPKWKGKICAPAVGTPYAYIALAIGEEVAKDLVRKLKEQQGLNLVPSITDVRSRVASGEFAIGIGITAGEYKGLGAPIENAPLEKTGGYTFYAVAMKDAKHPAAAKAYIVFLNSSGGKRMLHEVFAWSRHTTPDTDAWEIGKGGKGVFPSFEWTQTEEPRLTREFSQMLGIQ